MKGGSNRKYERITEGGRSVIRTTGTSREENLAFITLSRHFRSKGLNVPEVYSVSEDMMSYTQQDLGDCILYDAVAAGRNSGNYSEAEVELLKKALARLGEFQLRGREGLDWSVCYPDRELNARMVDFDLNYFKYSFLKPWGTEFNETRLQDDFDTLRQDILSVPSEGFMYRDFQARNVMLVNGEPYFIDFQGGRKGPLHYDVASFICQARSRFPRELKEELVRTYLEAVRRIAPDGLETSLEEDEFFRTLRIFMLLRDLQTLGAYGFRGLVENKAHFIGSIPYALKGLEELLADNDFSRYPYLCEVLGSLCGEQERKGGELEVEVISFSYRKGLPSDGSGNGGGYIFDCRSSHNPGRYPEYFHSSGRDADVIRFLEDDGEIVTFLDSVYKIVDFHVERYLERGFSHLQVAFGCTGGQHRSVYCAEKLAEHLRSRYDIKVKLLHRERENWPAK